MFSLEQLDIYICFKPSDAVFKVMSSDEDADLAFTYRCLPTGGDRWGEIPKYEGKPALPIWYFGMGIEEVLTADPRRQPRKWKQW